MTPQQFTSWLISHTDSLGHAPTEEEWANIKSVIASVQLAQVTTPSPYIYLGYTFPDGIAQGNFVAGDNPYFPDQPITC